MVAKFLDHNSSELDNGHSNDNCKKAIGLDWQSNNVARAPRFFVHFLAVVAPLQRESA